MSTKISDIQGMRGIAIIAVLVFHFFPEIFPNGFLGVDQFFVLSGFLMCMLLTKSENMPVLLMLSNFYAQRCKRILPLYQLIIMLSLLLLHFLLPKKAMDQNEKSAKNALLFMSNQLEAEQESYFEMISISSDIFTHTWSLSVEMQFYFIVPFIFLLPFKLASFSIISIISLVYHYSIPSNIAFLHMSSRIWQFLLGMIAFLLRPDVQNTYLTLNIDDYEKQQEEECRSRRTKTIETYALIIVTVIMVFWPITLPVELSRPITTLLTVLLLVTTSGENIFLSHKILTYIGDISYSLYMIHWPMYSYWKWTINENREVLIGSIDTEVLIYLAISILLSSIIYHTFEQWYMRLTDISVFILVVFLFLSNLAILNHRNVTYSET